MSRARPTVTLDEKEDSIGIRVFDKRKFRRELIVVWEQEQMGVFSGKKLEGGTKHFKDDRTGAPIRSVLEYGPPVGSAWVTEWKIHVDAWTDEAGWKYARSFTSTEWSSKKGKSVLGRNCRRRKWMRESVTFPKWRKGKAKLGSSGEVIPMPVKLSANNPPSLTSLISEFYNHSNETHQRQKHVTVFEIVERSNKGKWRSPSSRSRFFTSLSGSPVEGLDKVSLPAGIKGGFWYWACCWKIVLSRWTDANGWVKGNTWHLPEGTLSYKTKIRMWKRVTVWSPSHRKSFSTKQGSNLDEIDFIMREVLKGLFWHTILHSDNAVVAGAEVHPDQEDFDDSLYVLKNVKELNWRIFEFQIKTRCLSLSSEDQYYKIDNLRALYKLRLNPKDDKERQMFQLLPTLLRWLKDTIVTSAMRDDRKPMKEETCRETLNTLCSICSLYTEVKESKEVAARCLGFFIAATFLEVTGDVGGYEDGLFIFDELRKNAKRVANKEMNEFQSLATFHIDILSDMQNILEIVETNVEEDQELSTFETKVLESFMGKITELLEQHLIDYHDENPEIVHDTFNVYARMRRIYEKEAGEVNYESLRLIEKWMKSSAKMLFSRLWMANFSPNLEDEDISDEEFEKKWDAFIETLLSHIKNDLDLCDRLRKSGVLQLAESKTELHQHASFYLISQLVSVIVAKIHESEEAEKSIENQYGRLLMSGYYLQREIGDVLAKLEPRVSRKEQEIIALLSNFLDKEAKSRFSEWMDAKTEAMTLLMSKAVKTAEWKLVEGRNFCQVAVDCFQFYQQFVSSFFHYMKTFPDSFAKQGNKFFGKCLLQLIEEYLKKLRSATLASSEEAGIEEYKYNADDVHLDNWLSYRTIEVETYISYLKIICKRFCTTTQAYHYLERWEENFKSMIPESVDSLEYLQMMNSFTASFFQAARNLVKKSADEISKWLVTQMVSLQMRPFWKVKLWMRPVREHRLDDEFLNALKSYFQTLDDCLSDREYKDILAMVMREVDRGILWVLTDEDSKTAGRWFELADGRMLIEDLGTLDEFFRYCDYGGPGLGDRENPLTPSNHVVNLMNIDTELLIDQAERALLDVVRNSDVEKISNLLQVLSFRIKDKKAQDYVMITLAKKKKQECDDLLRGIMAKTSASMLTILVINGKRLAACDRSGLSDPYVIIKVAGQQKKTKAIKRTLNPIWKESFRFALPEKHFESHESLKVEFTCLDQDFVGRDDVIGHAVHHIERGQNHKPITLQLCRKKGEQYIKGSRGELTVSFHTRGVLWCD